MKSRLQPTMILFLLFYSLSGFSQQYFKLLEKSDKPYEQKIGRFSNGDLLIVGSPIRGQTADRNGGINILRLDPCGNVVWSKNFEWKQNYMTFKDVKINPDNEVYVYGTGYESGSEYIFILRLGPKGNELAYRMLHMGTVDNFTYNIQVLPNGGLMAYGLVLDFSTAKRGFLCTFDQNLNLQWGKVFSPFESIGEAILTQDGGFLCRSGVYTFKFSSTGNFLWATVFDSRESAGGFYPVGGPVAVQNGFVFEAIKDDVGFFYKIDPQGQLVWTSADFKTSGRAANGQIMETGDLFVVYNDPGNNENFPSQLTLSPAGQISRQRRLLIAQSLQTDAIYQSLASKGRVSIIGSQDLRAASADRYAGFLLQASIDSTEGTCFRWEDFSSVLAHSSPISIDTQAVSFFPFNPRYIEAKIDQNPWKFSFAQSCDLTQNHLIKRDSTLSCGQNWKVELPNADFIWEDGASGASRTFTVPGIYRASDYNCIAPTVYEYEVKREACACQVYLPNAFSPNGDGHNDQLRLYSNCTLENVQMSVYSRWGDRLFSANGPAVHWDGLARQKSLDPGVYLVAVQYRVLDESGNIQEGNLTQKVQLLRN